MNGQPGITGDILCNFRKSGFECDLVVRAKLPFSPADYGLNPDTCTIQLYTEFFDTQDPQQIPSVRDEWYGLEDHTLKFGALTMGRGKAFTTPESGGIPPANSTPVFKSWLRLPDSGRTFLVEQVPLDYLASQLNALPAGTNTLSYHSQLPSATFASASRTFPPLRRPSPSSRQIQVASANLNQKPGLVLDYMTINPLTTVTNYTFASTNTYFVTGPFYIEGGTLTIQGGAVIKFEWDPGATITIEDSSTPVICQTTADSPAIFTAKDDSSVGLPITTNAPPCSSGDVSYGCNYYGGAALWFNGCSPADLEHLRIWYAQYGIANSTGSLIRDCQFIEVGEPLYYTDSNTLENVLISDAYCAITGNSVNANNLTVDSAYQLVSGSLNATNCLFAAVAYTNSFAGSSNAVVPSDSGVFASGPLGKFYLATNSPYINAGSTTADKVGLYEYTTQTNVGSMEGSSKVDLGYHYLAVNSVTNPISTLVTNVPDYLSDANGNGLPDSWESNYFGSLNQYASELDNIGETLLYDYRHGINPTNTYPAGFLGSWHFDTADWTGTLGQLPLLATNIELVSGFVSNAVEVTNMDGYLLYNVVEANGHTNLDMQNGTVLFWFKPYWSSTSMGGTGPLNYAPLVGTMVDTNLDGYWELYLDDAGDILYFDSANSSGDNGTLTTSISWVSNQWHQIALTYSSSNCTLYVDGAPLATNSGVSVIPAANLMLVGNDFQEAAVGAFDELKTFNYPLSAFQIQADFVSYSQDPPFIVTQPQNQSVVVGSNATFIATAEGGGSLVYQWYFNTNTQVTGATSGQLVINSAQPVEAGNYFLVVTNGFGSVTSSVVTLTVLPGIFITNPVDGATFNATGVDVQGTFTTAALEQITVNGVLAFTSSNTFEALDVPLNPGTNVIVATIQDFDGNTNTASITVIGATNSDGSMNDPVQLQATPTAGFAPLPVSFTIQTNLPGTILQVFYDFNGDGIFDLATNNIQPITYTYATNGEYFPAVTIQTTAGWFSSSGGWNSIDPNRIQINVQSTPVILSTINITDPVDIKWTGSSNLYVLSGSTATITEFDANANVIRSLSGIGSNPSGLDVDAAGNVYVAVTGKNQVWKFDPTNATFVADTNFGVGGFIGDTNGIAGTNNGVFNAPFGVAVSPGGGTISVSDSGNDRIQQFTGGGVFITTFGTNGADFGQLESPEGITYDNTGALYITDSENNRIALAEGSSILGVSGSGGSTPGQFSTPAKVNVGERGIYVADTGNNRIQCFEPLENGEYSFTNSDLRFVLSTNLSAPHSVASVTNLTNELFFVADTGNNRVLLYSVAPDDPTPAWTAVTNSIVAGNISGAISGFSSNTADVYRQSFIAIGMNSLVSDLNQMGPLMPVFIKSDTAEYYFEKQIEGHNILFTVEFVKEHGVWKILQF